jgi:hypothetical protein
MKFSSRLPVTGLVAHATITSAAIGLPLRRVPAAAAEEQRPLRHLGQHADGACNGCDNGAGEHVAVLDVRQFMADHAQDLIVIELNQ